MNLYIWGDSGTVSYWADTLVVMAPNLREAKKAAKRAVDWSFGRERDTPIDRTPYRKKSMGKPDRVIKNKTYAAYFMASE